MWQKWNNIPYNWDTQDDKQHVCRFNAVSKEYTTNNLALSPMTIREARERERTRKRNRAWEEIDRERKNEKLPHSNQRTKNMDINLR